MSPPRVAVVGGGLAGLAAACQLRSLGVHPTIFEAADQVGGVVRSEARNGWLFESGPVALAEPDAAVRVLLDGAGVGACTLRATGSYAARLIMQDGKPVPLPRTTADFAASPLLSLAGRLRMIRERFIPAAAIPDETVDAFARRRFGDEMAERMFDPLITSIGGDPRTVLARFALKSTVAHEAQGASALQGGARARMQARRRQRGVARPSWTCTQGMQQMARYLADHAGEVRCSSGVVAITPLGKSVEVTTNLDGPTQFHAAMICVPSAAMGGIAWPDTVARMLAPATRVPYAPLAVVSLGFRRDAVGHALDASRMLVPSTESSPLLAVSFASSLFPAHAPDDHTLLTCYLGGALHPGVVELDDGALIAVALDRVTAALDITGPAIISRIKRWPEGAPLPVAGHGERLAAANLVEREHPMLGFAGAWRDGFSVSDVMSGAIASADRLAVRQGWRAPDAGWH